MSNIHELQGEIMKLLKLPNHCTRVVLTMEVDKIPRAVATFYDPEPGIYPHATKTATFECLGDRSVEVPRV